jgi:endonuclease III
MPALSSLIRTLEKAYGEAPAPPSRDPFALVLWEQIGYLVSDDKRAVAFRRLETEIGIDAKKILKASPEQLESIVKDAGSVAVAQRATKLRTSAQIVVDEHGGDLTGILKLPTIDALKALRAFDSIGAPGAEKILLICGAADTLPLESNGLRVLVRFGFGQEHAQYAKMYRSVQDAIANDLPKDLYAAHALLRLHGQETCRRSSPRCSVCPVRKNCAHATRS